MEGGKFAADFQRLETLKKFLGISYQEMAATAGIKNPQSFYAVKAGKQGITKMMANAIVSAWPEISETWLVTGRGKMMEKDNAVEQTPAPSGELITIEKRVLDTIISQQETIRIQASTIQELAKQKGNAAALQVEAAGCADAV